MTEQEWLACTDSQVMLQWMGNRWKRRLSALIGFRCPRKRRRKFYLFVGACCVRSTEGIPHPGHGDLLANVSLGSGKITPEEFEATLDQFSTGRKAEVAVESWAAGWALAAARGKAWGKWVQANFQGGMDYYNSVRNAELRQQCHLVRCIFGNPFRSATLDQAWLTNNVTALAQGICDDRAFDRLPILADALEDVGCTDQEILAHCRGPDPHVRGCWVLDLLRGKG